MMLGWLVGDGRRYVSTRCEDLEDLVRCWFFVLDG